MKWRLIFAALAVVAACTTTRYAHATTCNWGTITVCNFGVYNPSTVTDDTTTGSLVISCSGAPGGGEATVIGISNGSSGVYTAREYTGANFTYNMYWNAAYTQPAGSIGPAAKTVFLVNGNNTVTIYCKMNALQAMPVASYTDSTTANFAHFNPSESKTTNFFPLTSVAKYCSASISGNLAFGAYTSGSNLDSTATASVNCTSGTTYTVMVGQGTYPTGASTDPVPVRQMAANASDRLGYFIYQNAGRTTVWGNTAGSAPAAYTGSGSAQSITMYGRVPSGASSATGSYSDTVVVSVTY